MTNDMTRRAIRGPFAWHGEDIVDNPVWQHRMRDAELAEIDAALAATRKHAIEWPQVRREHFPLNTLAETLAEAGRELEEGCGMMRLRGLPVEKYSESDLRTLWMGIGAYIGTPVFQDADGQIMRRIRNEGSDVGERYGQIETGNRDAVFLSSRARTASAGSLRFHTDRTDVVGLLCLQQAKSGGDSKLASSVSVHNALLERRPDLLELLYQPIWRSRLGEEAGGEKLAYPLPVFGYHHEKFTSHYSRTYIEAAQLQPGVPKMSATQWEALDLLAELAEELCFEMRFESGDMQFLNNHVIFHARSAFEDDPAENCVRDLYRLWLCVPNGRALPQDHAVLWGNVDAGMLRGGIRPAAGDAPGRRLES